ncbi:uncharacterized protein LOC103302906 isoform X3 [Eptesicus fuscus]|uniref:uncharacterized protein LOC103302906 isoform X3 n=1 Tax=Eptesicus fuscus TaxID=29078 RepID=UPI002403E7FF|nr:uncharacterized protein LOC103302906 isoform X3 [Eptesicus fuscus]
MSDKAIEDGEWFAADALLQESQSDEEEEPSQPSSAGSTPGGPPPGQPSEPPMGPGSDSTGQPKNKKRNFSSTAVKVGAAVIGGVVAVGAVPVVLGAMGFTSTGIAAGAAGLSTSSKILLGLTGSSFGAWWGSSAENDSDKDKK